ncbi:MAG: tetratricopeptide repeat protein [Salinivirgaceae bacterium]|nr:tetratricopeptide repeat protein [Salinivirgaceae bacterium]
MIISAKINFFLKHFLFLSILISLESFSFKPNDFNKKDNSVLCDSGNIKTSILNYEKALENHRQTKDLEGIAAAMCGLGKVYSDKGDFENALEYFLKSLTIEKELNNHKNIADLYEKIAGVYNRSGNSRKALENFEKALKIYSKLENREEIANAFNHIGLIYSNWEKYEKALNYFHKSLEIKEILGNKIGVANCYNNMAYIYYRWGDFTQALEYNMKSLKIYEQLNNERKKTDVINNIGLIYIETKEYDNALKFILKSLELEKKLNNKLGVAKSYNNIGLIYHKQGNLQKAYTYYIDALAITEEMGDMEQLAIGYSNIGTIYLHNNKVKKALYYLEKSTEIAKTGNYKRTLMYNYRSFSSAYAILNDNKKAFSYYKIYVAEKDSVFNKEKHKQINELKILYETEKKEQEIILLNTENNIDKIKLKTQKKEIVILAAGFIIILFLLILTFIYSTKRNIAYNDLVSKNVEIVNSEKKLRSAKKQSEILVKEKNIYLIALHEKLNNKVTSIFKYIDLIPSLEISNNGNPNYKKLIKKECDILSSEINNIPEISKTNTYQIPTNDKYINSPISENQRQEILEGIEDLIENKKVFLDKDISLEKMANYLKTNKKYISQIINENYDQNVSNFINEYRIKEARRLLSDPAYKNITIEGIATTVGFNSKSAFNISFKKITGITPSFYQKSLSTTT